MPSLVCLFFIVFILSKALLKKPFPLPELSSFPNSKVPCWVQETMCVFKLFSHLPPAPGFSLPPFALFFFFVVFPLLVFSSPFQFSGAVPQSPRSPTLKNLLLIYTSRARVSNQSNPPPIPKTFLHATPPLVPRPAPPKTQNIKNASFTHL